MRSWDHTPWRSFLKPTGCFVLGLIIFLKCLQTFPTSLASILEQVSHVVGYENAGPGDLTHWANCPSRSQHPWKILSMIYAFRIKKKFQAHFFYELLIVKQTQHGFRLQNLLRQTHANLTFSRSSITFNSWARCPTAYTSIQYTDTKAGIWSVTGESEIT